MTATETGRATASNWASGSWHLYTQDQSGTQELDVLNSQIKELHSEFAHWPGSYNQLLLAGSLDYCRSAIKRAKDKNLIVQQDTIKILRSYYSACLSFFDQYHDSQTALRRLNLQSLQEKFEIVQDICAKRGIYPRLEELDIADVPCDQ